MIAYFSGCYNVVIVICHINIAGVSNDISAKELALFVVSVQKTQAATKTVGRYLLLLCEFSQEM